MLVARGLLEGTLQPSAEIAEMLNECALCGYCQARCAPNNLEIMEALRAALVKAGFTAAAHRDQVHRIIDTGSLFDAPSPRKRAGTTPLFLGCLYRSRPVETARIVSILERASFDPLIADEVCCGYVVNATGFTGDFETQRRRFEDSYGRWGDRAQGTNLGTEILTFAQPARSP